MREVAVGVLTAGVTFPRHAAHSSPPHRPGRSTSPARPPAAAGSSSAQPWTVLERAGYEELIPPTFEYEDTFLRAGGPGVAERLVRFPDRDGRILALRYDFTASLARVAATTFADAARPLRLCYSGTVYRQEPERGGRPREMLQVGAELLGQGDLAADVEIVRLTLALVRAAGLADFQVNLGHAGVLAPGLARPRRAAAHRACGGGSTARTAAASAARSRALDGDARSLTVLPFVIGRREALEAALGSAPRAAARRASSTCSRSTTRSRPDERAHVVYDLGEVRGLEYYTGDALRGLRRRRRPRGRRRRPLRRADGPFGRPMPAVGVSLDLDTIAEVPA